ncbi:MAG: MerR family transcriptional regulator [Pseudomonadota bacterium]
MEKSADAFRTISEVADLLETPAHVLRFWESRFPQIKPVKRAGGRRYYRPSDVALLTGIKQLLHDEGMTIRGVQRILREQGVRHVAGLTDDPSPEEEALEAAMLARLDVEEVFPRTTLEIAAEQALALEAALDAAPVAVVLPFRLPEAMAEAAVTPAPALPDDSSGAPNHQDEMTDEITFHAADVGPVDVAPVDVAPVDVGPGPELPATPKGPALTLTSVTGATRTPAPLPAEATAESVPDLPAAAPPESAPPEPAPEGAEPPPPPLGNRLRALPRTALAARQDEARAALARLTALRNRLANPVSPPRN